ncbi:putative succinate--hydroxymethylglutarate CoA-transferase-like [Apostichopus japonicus]|uniref:Putative succinate--hydroxymethylglutarate CoA-transferase-like n=1 Tax=Stichopus japonicus TaxID=307972 RepID=A0A2G8KGL9_STIJA|nr:putative succinate--hydroxymethylglutarate CoA-transferase-like [Apostichopus japonicus]
MFSNGLRFWGACVTRRATSAGIKTNAILKDTHQGVGSPESVSKGPLHGVRILDLSRVLAGPFCTMLFGDLGAEVIKVEQPGVGDDTRGWGPPFAGDQSCYYLSVNRNKKSVAINLKTPGGKRLIRELATKCDILVENFVPGKLAEFGLGYEDLKILAPSLIYCSITGFGPDGPYANRAGFDVIAAAMGGLLHITGPEDGEPCAVGIAITDLSTGLFAKGAILAALYQREKTGLGQKIDCNLLSTQVALLINRATDYLMTGMEAKRAGTGRISIVPYQAFKTKDDRYLVIGAGNDNLFRSLCKVIKLGYLLEDDRFLKNEDRVKHRGTLIPIIQKRLMEKSLSEWLEILDGTTLPYSPVQSMEQVFNDPQVLHNNLLLEMQHKSMGTIKVPGPATSYSHSTQTEHSPPPLLGEHTVDVLHTVLGLTPQEIDKLKTEGTIDAHQT